MIEAWGRKAGCLGGAIKRVQHLEAIVKEPSHCDTFLGCGKVTHQPVWIGVVLQGFVICNPAEPGPLGGPLLPCVPLLEGQVTFGFAPFGINQIALLKP